ncbi:ATP-binding protein [Kribbella sp. NPDC058245]|uniref:ATP-binding protein n=1 Tax=Kribbella sp. NPDC058245 TaxID=3346399 RepID=UPI0036EDBE06
MERALAVRLTLAGGEGVSDQRLSRDLWDDIDDERIAQRLRVLTHRLRGRLGPHRDLLRRTAVGYRLDACAIDLVALERAQARLAGAGEGVGREALLRDAVGLWRDDSLVDVRSFPFARGEAERLDAVRLDLQVDLYTTELELGNPVMAEIERLAATHPLHEPIVALSVLALYRAGRQADALNRLTALRNALAAEYGVSLSPESADLELKLLRQDPHLAAGDPVVAVARRVPEPAPVGSVSATPFVGRDADRTWLLQRLRRPVLVTLTGGPGVGKTRLAREVVACLGGRRTAWLDLASVSTRGAMVAGLAAAAGVTEGSGDVLARSADALAGAVLVVDNAEHLVDPVADLLSVVRRTSDGLSVLVTSQRAIRMEGEEVRQVGPLAIEAATELFCARSGAAADADVTAVCTAVECWPLAVELAAGLTRTLSVRQLAERIEYQVRLLVGGLRDSTGRHSSLRAAIDWSHSLLDEPSRVVLRRMAVFDGGCTLDAVEQVVAMDPITVTLALADLQDRCLLAVDNATGGSPRFRLLLSIRDHGLEQLGASGEESDVRRRHANWCAELAAGSERYGGQNHGELLGELMVEEANLRAAIEWSLDHEATWVTRIIAPSWWYWWVRGLLADALDWLGRCLAALDPEPTTERAYTLRAIASLTRNGGDLTKARAIGDQALAIFRELGHQLGCATTLLGLSITNICLRDYETALTQSREASAVALALGNDRIRGAAIDATGGALRCLGRLDAAEDVFLEVEQLWITMADSRGLASTRAGLAMIARQRGELPKARAYCLDALRTYQELDLTEGQLEVLELIACLEVDEGRPTDALRLLTVASRDRRRLGVPSKVPDELVARDNAEASALQALGPAAGQIVDAATEAELASVVGALLR